VADHGISALIDVLIVSMDGAPVAEHCVYLAGCRIVVDALQKDGNVAEAARSV
jgi:hypothetical protein